MILPPAFRRPAKLGFTIVELLLVIAISTIVFGLTVPSAIRFYQNQVVDDAARSLKSALDRARVYAITMRNDRAFGVKILSQQFVLFQGASYATRLATEDEFIEYASNITVTGTVSEVVFSKLYATSSASGTMVLTSDSGAWKILTVTNSGNVDLQ